MCSIHFGLVRHLHHHQHHHCIHRHHLHTRMKTIKQCKHSTLHWFCWPVFCLVVKILKSVCVCLTRNVCLSNSFTTKHYFPLHLMGGRHNFLFPYGQWSDSSISSIAKIPDACATVKYNFAHFFISVCILITRMVFCNEFVCFSLSQCMCLD